MRALPWRPPHNVAKETGTGNGEPVSSENCRQRHGASLELSELSQRLLAHFEAQTLTDCDFGGQVSSIGAAGALGAHRLVLQRNPHLALTGSKAAKDGSVREHIEVSQDVSCSVLRCVLYAHYLDAPAKRGSFTSPASAYLEDLQARLPRAEWRLLEDVFGPLAAQDWLPLAETTLGDERFCDCTLKVGNGARISAHRVVLTEMDGASYFSSAFDWPGAGTDVELPDDLSESAMRSLLRIRCGGQIADVECILECRHFADFFGWAAAQASIDEALEAFLREASDVEADSALAVFTYCAESPSAIDLPEHLKQAAHAAAVKWFLVASEDAKQGLSSQTRLRLRIVSKILGRFGHVCSDIREYLYAAADDLVEWETRLGPDTPQLAKICLENQWHHWDQMVLDVCRLDQTIGSLGEWRRRVHARRTVARQQRLCCT